MFNLMHFGDESTAVHFPLSYEFECKKILLAEGAMTSCGQRVSNKQLEGYGSTSTRQSWMKTSGLRPRAARRKSPSYAYRMHQVQFLRKRERRKGL